jgi:hypothetical protein
LGKTLGGGMGEVGREEQVGGEKMAETATEEPMESAMAAIAASVMDVAASVEGDTRQLLEVLRFLENLHRQVRDSYFQQSLPDSRQSLYALLRDIELNGGWPNIRRVHLDALMWELKQALDYESSHG